MRSVVTQYDSDIRSKAIIEHDAQPLPFISRTTSDCQFAAQLSEALSKPCSYTLILRKTAQGKLLPSAAAGSCDTRRQMYALPMDSQGRDASVDACKAGCTYVE